MHHFIHFFILYLPQIIQWIIATILFFLGLLFVNLVLNRGRNQSEDRGEIKPEDLSSIEKTLKEIIKNTNEIASSSLLKSSSPSSVSSPNTELIHSSKLSDENQASLEKMMQELALKEAEIKILKESQTHSQNQAKKSEENTSSGNDADLKRIKELESRLAEYEIIEDDIADLSLYKEENSRLKNELEALKKAGGSSPLSISAPVGEQNIPAGEVAVSSETLPDLSIKVEGHKEVSFIAVDDPIQTQASNQTPVSTENQIIGDDLSTISVETPQDDLTADIEFLNQALSDAANGGNKNKNGLEETPPVVEERMGQRKFHEIEDGSEQEDDDLLAEFSRSLGKMNQPPSLENHSPVSKGGALGKGAQGEFEDSSPSVNAEKVLEEMASLDSLGDIQIDTNLESEIDTEKMAREAKQLASNE